MTHYERIPPTNIHDLVWELCAKLEVGEPEHVARIEILPTKVIVESYRRRPGKGIRQMADGTPAKVIVEVPVKT